MRMYVCAWCDASIPDTGKGGTKPKFCGRPCQRKADHRAQRPSMTCERCHATFPPRKGPGNSNRFCTGPCYQAAKREDRIREYQITESGRICAYCRNYRRADELYFKSASRYLVHGFEPKCKQCYSDQRLARIGKPPKSQPVACAVCSAPYQRKQGRSGTDKWCSDPCREIGLADSKRRGQLWRNYGVTPEWYDATLAEQGGACAVCRASDRTALNGGPMPVDHDHETRRARGILCGWCNSGLGYFNDDPVALRNAAAYLLAHAEQLELTA